MQWTNQQLEKRAKIYNRIYFNNEIERPIVIQWSRHMYNADSSINAYCKSYSTHHLIMFNVSYSHVSDEIMRSTLVHEMIHAWQAEHDPNWRDDWENVKGHGPSFIQKCEELNAKFKFTYPLMRYTAGNKLANLKKQNTDVYYVYKITTSTVDQSISYPIGVFVKFLYREEIVNLQNKGLSVKYYPNARFSNDIEYPALKNKRVAQTDVPVAYTRIKKCTADNFVQTVKDEFGFYHMATDDDFNFNDGLDIEV